MLALPTVCFARINGITKETMRKRANLCKSILNHWGNIGNYNKTKKSYINLYD